MKRSRLIDITCSKTEERKEREVRKQNIGERKRERACEWKWRGRRKASVYSQIQVTLWVCPWSVSENFSIIKLAAFFRHLAPLSYPIMHLLHGRTRVIESPSSQRRHYCINPKKICYQPCIKTTLKKEVGASKVSRNFF